MKFKCYSVWSFLTCWLARNVHSVAEALMMLLDSFDESVIPTDFYQQCLDVSHDAAHSRQVRHFSDSISLPPV